MTTRRAFVCAAMCGSLMAAVAAAQTEGRRFRIGGLGVGSPGTSQHLLDAQQAALRELGWVEGRNLVFEARWAHGAVDRLPALAAELAQWPADIIVVGTNVAIVAARQATATIPIVMVLPPTRFATASSKACRALAATSPA